MKMYFYLVISFGIMLMLAMAGVDGIGTQIRTLFIENDTVIQPDTQYNNTGLETVDQFTDKIFAGTTNLWDKILIALLAMVAIGIINGIQVLGSGASFDIRRITLAIIAYSLFGIVVSDMWTLVTLSFSYGVAWISWTLFTIITLFIIGFALATLEFTGGTD